MNQPLRSKEYFDQRATEEMGRFLKTKDMSLKERLAYSARILAMISVDWVSNLRRGRES